MSKKATKTLDIQTRMKWREWLAKYHDSVAEIWLIFNKRNTGLTSLAYEDAVEEALCYGWIDSIVKCLDDTRYVRKFTPRSADSKWSTANGYRYFGFKASDTPAVAPSCMPSPAADKNALRQLALFQTGKAGIGLKVPPWDIEAVAGDCLDR